MLHLTAPACTATPGCVCVAQTKHHGPWGMMASQLGCTSIVLGDLRLLLHVM